MAMDGFTWVTSPETGGFWQCPDGALDDMIKLGWQPCEAPREPNPAVDERLAWLAEQDQAAKAAAAEKAAAVKTTKPARRGETQED